MLSGPPRVRAIAAISVALALFAPASFAREKAPQLGKVFGMAFALRLEPTLLGASLDPSPFDEATQAIVFAALDVEAPLEHAGWHHANPSSTPKLLRNQSVDYYAQIDAERHALLVVADLGANCSGNGETLRSLIDKKYGLGAEPLAVSSLFSTFYKWAFRERRALLMCSSAAGWLVYADPGAITRKQAHDVRNAKARKKLLKTAQIVQANRFAHGTRRSIDGGFGVMFAGVFPNHETLPVDAPASVELQDLRPPFQDGQFEVTLSPSGYPIRIAGVFDNLTLDWAAPLLEAKFGTPRKRSDKHIIHKVAGNFAVLKKRSPGQLEIVFIDGEGQTGMKARARAHQEATWQDEVDGL